MRGMTSNAQKRTNIPFRGLYVNVCLFDFVPIGRQGGSTRFDEALHHRPSRILISARIELLEEPIKRRIPTGVWVLIGRLILFLAQNFRRHLVPVLVLLARFKERLVCRPGTGWWSWF